MDRSFVTRRDVKEYVLDSTENYLEQLTNEQVESIVNYIVKKADYRYENITREILDDCDYYKILGFGSDEVDSDDSYQCDTCGKVFIGSDVCDERPDDFPCIRCTACYEKDLEENKND